MTNEDITPEEIEQAAREHVFPPVVPVAHATLIEGPDKFWELMREFGEQPLLQDLVQAWYGRTGQPERPDTEGERLIRLVLALSDLLEAAADHNTRKVNLDEDTELAYIVFGALSPDSTIHNTAMRDFDAWLGRRNTRKVEELKQYAPDWIRSRRAGAARRCAFRVVEDDAEEPAHAC